MVIPLSRLLFPEGDKVPFAALHMPFHQKRGKFLVLLKDRVDDGGVLLHARSGADVPVCVELIVDQRVARGSQHAVEHLVVRAAQDGHVKAHVGLRELVGKAQVGIAVHLVQRLKHMALVIVFMPVAQARPAFCAVFSVRIPAP